MAMTICEYGGARLLNAHIAGVDQSVVYDRSNTDQLAVTTTLSIRGQVFLGTVGDTTRPGVTAFGDYVPSNPEQLVQTLSRPRKPLRVWITRGIEAGERVLWDVVPASDRDRPRSNQDCDNGPKPVSVRIEAVHPWGWDVEFRVQFTMQGRNYQGSPKPDAEVDWALNNRWSCTEALDQDFFCTKTYSGVIRLTQPIPIAQVYARLLAFPQLEPGFRRDSCDYSVSENGLEVAYRISDRQVAHAAPWPATRFEVRHTETLQQFGHLIQSACQVQLWAPPGVHKHLLLARVAQIFRDRLLWDQLIGNASFVDSLRITDEIGSQNTVIGELVINRYPDVVQNSQSASGKGFWEGFKDGAGAVLNTGPEAEPPGSASPDLLRRLTRDVLGTDITFKALNPGPAVEAARQSLGDPEADPLHSIRPHPNGYSGWGTVRDPAAIIFFACYHQIPERPPHHFHPGEDKPPNPPLGDTEVSDGRNYATPRRTDDFAALYPAGDSADPLSRSHVEAIYTLARIQNDYAYDHGREIMTKTFTDQDEDEDDLVVVDFARPKLIRRMVYEGERIGAWPDIPAPTDWSAGDAYGRLLRHRIQPQPPTLAADGRRLIYRVRAEYEWAVPRASAVRVLDSGTLPYIRADAVAPLSLDQAAKRSLVLAQTGATSQNIQTWA